MSLHVSLHHPTKVEAWTLIDPKNGFVSFSDERGGEVTIFTTIAAAEAIAKAFTEATAPDAMPAVEEAAE